jgi:hypothetical protein
MRGRGVGPYVAEGAEARPLGGDTGKGVENVAGRAGRAWGWTVR